MGATMDFAFLHGGGQGGWVWDEVIAQIAAQSDGAARCLALDAPGCGEKRGRDTGQIEFADIARELIADIEAAGLHEVVLVGHSQAGMTMPDMAAMAPGLIRRMIFITCSAPLPGKTTLDQMGTGLHGSDPEAVGWPVDPAATTMEERFRVMFCNDMAPADQDAFLARLLKDAWPDAAYTERGWSYEHLADVACTYVLCLQDQVLTPHWQRIYADRFRCERTVHIDAAHQVQNTRPQALAEVLLAECRA